jgi:stearoyl-CoA desaturase (delta-9 desaturase)
VFLAIIGAAQLQRSIIWWARHHRAHHWYLDTDKDPYDSRKGFFFTHIGWLIGHTPKEWGLVSISDLKQDPVVLWQHRYYEIIAPLGCFGLPTMIAHYGWNDWQGGLVYAGFFRVLLNQQVTYLVNSLNHSKWAGRQPYSDKNSAVNNLLTGILASGEGYHNFHHTFPADFRNGVQWYEFDISNYLIWIWCQLGLATNPVMVSKFEIERARERQRRGNQVDGAAENVEEDYQVLSQLPRMQWAEFLRQANTGRCLVCIDGVVHDISGFMGEHPGGRDLLHEVLANDGTAAFYNGFHDHSPYARRILASMRVATLEGAQVSNWI